MSDVIAFQEPVNGNLLITIPEYYASQFQRCNCIIF